MKITIAYPMTSTGPTHLSNDWMIQKEIELEDDDILAIGDKYLDLREKREKGQIKLNKYCETCKHWDGKNFDDEPCKDCNDNDHREAKATSESESADKALAVIKRIQKILIRDNTSAEADHDAIVFLMDSAYPGWDKENRQ